MVFADMIKLRTLRWRDYPGLAWKACCDHRVPYKGRKQSRKASERENQSTQEEEEEQKRVLGTSKCIRTPLSHC